ncbi:MAG: alanine--tRNA ligase, partial [Patescibacteria group bacterium]
MRSEEIRKRFLEFFKKRGHAIIPSAPLVPENDPSVLFTTAGMQPLVPYLLGEKHPAGDTLANVQKCVRTQDIEEVGDKTHDTFFEMLGNWSLGSYFKKEAIRWSYEFLTSKEEGLGLAPERLYVTVFGGNKDAPKDTESFEIWKSIGVPENHIFFMEGELAEKNWWGPGSDGPCGPDTEMFYDVVGGLSFKSLDEFLAADANQEIVEIWNDVFMEYEKRDGKVIGKLKQKNVDTGAGLERLAMVMQGKDNIFDTDLFSGLMKEISEMASSDSIRAKRIIADHIRTAVFIIGDGVVPSNTDRGYILRRLLRRAVRYSDVLGIKKEFLPALASEVVQKYREVYPNLLRKSEEIQQEIAKEEEKFRRTLAKGEKEFEKFSRVGISGADAFMLFSTYGFPIEMTTEMAEEKGIAVDVLGFAEEMKKHQELSRIGAEKKFKGGLADTGEETTRLHTATHLMLAGLRKYLGDHVHQAGSNITTERTRFDFTHPEKVSREILDKVEAYVNEAAAKRCNIIVRQVPKEQAKKEGVEGSFWVK